MIVFRLFYGILLYILLLNCSPFSKKKGIGEEKSIHLLLNATGFATEFCVFEIDKTENLECKNPRKAKSYPNCVEYYPENSNYAALTSKETLDQIYKGLADMELVKPELKNSIKNVGFIISGSINSSQNSESKKILTDVESHFRSEEIKVKTKSIAGEEEVKLTAKAIQDSEEIAKTLKTEIALLQIGPESVQIIPSFSAKNLNVISSKIGIQLMLEELSNIKPGIATCRQPISSFFKSEASSFDKCKIFIKENLEKSNRLKDFSKLALGDSYKVYSTGSTWNYYYPNKEEISLDELNKTGNDYCSLTIDQILKKGIKKKNAYNLCYSLAYKAVLAETLGIKKLQILQKNIYLKNLATSSLLFPDACR